MDIMEGKYTREEKKFLDEINRLLPQNIDWKRGAVKYLNNIGKEKGSCSEIYHLIKPFVGGPDFSTFFEAMYGFLNALQICRE